MKKSFKRIIAAAASIAAIFSSVPFAAPANAAAGLLAFPGAVGGGKYATGGRGGEVYHVTNLNDSGTGSFRDAVSKSGRIVVFDVGGTIELKSAVVCQSNVTIAGQTAPGGAGITLKNYKFGMGGENIIVRYISSRPGPYNATSSGNDAWGGAGGGNSIIDHCSIGWSSDEQWGLYSKNDNYTCQYSVIGPANSWGGHDKGIHGFGIMFGRANFTFDHNLIIHNVSRNFRGKVTDKNAADFTNNIIYDWGYQTTYGTIGHVNYVNNTLKAGNSTASGYHYAQVSDNANFMLYLSGNRILNKDNTVRNGANDNWNAISYSGNKNYSSTYSATHFPITVGGEDVSTAITAESAEASYDHVINFAGNGISPTKRTAIDQQCAAETKNGTGSCSGTFAYDSSVTDLDKYHIQCGVTYSYPAAVTAKEIVDADNDGMDDEWELARGLDPADPTDYKGDYCGQGYMNIEYYINDLTVDSFPEGVVTLSPTGSVTPIDPVSAFETIEAESYAQNENVRTEDLASGGQNIGFITNGSWAMYRKVDFGEGAKSFTGVISGNPCTMELYLDSVAGTPVATVAFAGTTGFSDYQTVSFNIPKISGTHNLYIKFTGGEGYLMNADSFIFGKDAIPMNGKLFTDVFVDEGANPNYWNIGYDAQAGSKFFGDRDFTIAEILSDLQGAEILMTSCDAKGVTGDAVTFTAGDNMSLYIGLDSRVETEPAWLGDFVRLRGQFTSSNDVTFNVYQKDVKAGEKVTLGGNGQTYMCVNYTVFAKKGEEVPTEPEKVTGDINSDGSVNVSDLVALSKHLLGSYVFTSDEAERADINGDGRVNVFDFVELRELLAK